jgi:hypothetical protein
VPDKKTNLVLNEENKVTIQVFLSKENGKNCSIPEILLPIKPKNMDLWIR